MSNNGELTTITNNDMEEINKLTRKKLNPDEVYTFSVILCDNETDRDCERFSVSALEKLAEMFIGRTGIFDHDPKGANQTARIYSAEIARDTSRKTRSGEVYVYIKAKAYMMRTEKNLPLITEIEGGIKKEVSVSCSVSKEVCSICGADRRRSPCSHVKGQYYSGKLCEGILDEPTDAYEWSFVAIPAQVNAGVTKSCGGADAYFDAELKSLRKKLDRTNCELSLAAEEITAEIISIGQFCAPPYSPETVKRLCGGMNIAELIAFKESTKKQAIPESPKSVISFEEKENAERANSRFKLKRN